MTSTSSVTRFPATSPSSSPTRSEWPWAFWVAAVVEVAWLLLLAWMAVARS
jgi:hypothetical protein